MDMVKYEVDLNMEDLFDMIEDDGERIEEKHPISPFVLKYGADEISDDKKYGLLLTIHGYVWGQFNTKEISPEEIAVEHGKMCGPAKILEVFYEDKRRIAIVSIESDILDEEIVSKRNFSSQP